VTSQQGTPGPQGEVGPQGPPGPSAVADGGLPTGCLSPCHGFGGIVEQWKTSTHYAAFVSNLGGDEVPTWTGATACGNCHAIDGIEQRVAGNVSSTGGTVTNLASGQLGYKNASGAYTEPLYGGTAKVAAVTCTTCHEVSPATDPHVTGQPWAVGGFPLRVPTGADDSAYIEKSPDTTAITGTALKLGTSNACVWCHKARKDVTAYAVAGTKVTSTRWGPHEGPQSDVFSGSGGYHFPGKTYGQSTHRQRLACVDCHMPSVSTNGNTANHSFYAQLSACNGCHAGAKSFDVAGGQSTVKAALFELQRALNDAGMLTRATAAPYDPLSAAELADGAFATDTSRPNPSVTLTADQAGALYNYFIVTRGGALGVHNPTYVKQIVFDSFVAIKGTAPTTLTRP
jgi:hypothetical protein